MLPIINGLNYLCSPFSHADPHVREERYREVLAAHVRLLKAGHLMFTPIIHTYHASKQLGRVVDHDFWMAQDIPILVASKRVLVLTLDGWEHSRGIAEEVSIAVKNRIPVLHIAPGEL